MIGDALTLGAVPGLEDLVEVPGGRYRLGPPGEERTVAVRPLLIGRHPVVNAVARAFAAERGLRPDPGLAARLGAEALADHPVTGLTYAQAEDLCDWAADRLGRPVRLPTGDEWEAAARGGDARAWPWGDVFDPERCACVEAGWGGTMPVTAHPAGASPCGAEQLAGNVWEWVAADPDADGWRAVRGGSHLDTAVGVRAWRSLPADPERATATTGLRLAVPVTDPEEEP